MTGWLFISGGSDTAMSIIVKIQGLEKGRIAMAEFRIMSLYNLKPIGSKS